MKKLGEILIEHGSIKQDQLQEALDKQKKEPNRYLGELLIELGYLTEEDIVVALATQFKVPYLPVSNYTINETVLPLIPQELVMKYICVPLEQIGNLLMMVIADPTSEQAIKEIEKVTKCKVQLFVATTSELIAAIETNYHVKMNRSVAAGENVKAAFKSAAQQKKEGLSK